MIDYDDDDDGDDEGGGDDGDGVCDLITNI